MKKNNKQSGFIQTVWNFYKIHKRNFPWRNTANPYRIFISEVMLQQTQVSRVLIKYPVFISQFSTFKQLARAPLSEILRVWQGMGYNRRALYLKKAADIIVSNHMAILPNDPALLDTLPGIGKATAASIVVFAYNIPTVFIETNIRRVFIHHFFLDKDDVSDKQIELLVAKTVDMVNPREWYWALMDYGSYLGKIVDNPNKKSKHYTIQSQFKGSDRQIRGKIVKLLLEDRKTEKEMIEKLKIDKMRLKSILDSLEKEGFIEKKKDVFILKS